MFFLTVVSHLQLVAFICNRFLAWFAWVDKPNFLRWWQSKCPSFKTCCFPPAFFFSQASCSLLAEKSRWDRVWGWMENTISKWSRGSYRCVKNASAYIMTQLTASPHKFSSVLFMCSDLLCRDADWFPKGVCDPSQRADWQLLRGVWTKVCTMMQWHMRFKYVLASS